MVCERNQLRTDDPLLGHQLDLAGMPHQLRGEQHDDVIDVLSAIPGGLLPFQIGVDRHLGDTASSDRIDEVDRCGAALRSNEVQSRIGDLEVHLHSQPGNGDRAKDLVVAVVCWP